MFEISYHDVVDDSPHTLRERERKAMTRVIEMLKTAQECGAGTRKAVEALHYLKLLWTIFLDDLRGPDNELPDQLKAGIISIGIWMLKEIDRARAGTIKDFTAMIEINEIIRNGLA